jgi:hypothetical protein
VRGFINNEFAAEYYPAFLSQVGAGIADGRIRYREDFVNGLENAGSDTAKHRMLPLFSTLLRISPDFRYDIVSRNLK